MSLWVQSPAQHNTDYSAVMLAFGKWRQEDKETDSLCYIVYSTLIYRRPLKYVVLVVDKVVNLTYEPLGAISALWAESPHNHLRGRVCGVSAKWKRPHTVWSHLSDVFKWACGQGRRRGDRSRGAQMS